MFTWPIVTGPAGVPLETILLVLVALAAGVLLARIALSFAWKLLLVGILVIGAVYATGILL